MDLNEANFPSQSPSSQPNFVNIVDSTSLPDSQNDSAPVESSFLNALPENSFINLNTDDKNKYLESDNSLNNVGHECPVEHRHSPDSDDSESLTCNESTESNWNNVKSLKVDEVGIGKGNEIHPSCNNSVIIEEDLDSEKQISCQSFDKCSPSIPNSSLLCFTPVKKKSKTNQRRVSFPEDPDLVTSYLEPVNPWKHMRISSTDEIVLAYKKSCDLHCTEPLPHVIQQVRALPDCIAERFESLNLKGQRLDSKQCEVLEEIFRRIQFKSLNFEGCYLEDDPAISLLGMIEYYHSATKINISNNYKIGRRGWSVFANMLKCTPSIEYLNAGSTNLNQQNMSLLCSALKMGSALRILHLENCNLTGKPLLLLAEALKLNKFLTELYLAENRLGEFDCLRLGNLLRVNLTLTLLDLRNNNLQDRGCCNICEGVADQKKQLEIDNPDTESKLKGLSSLILWNNQLTRQSAIHISLMLKDALSLEMLDLGYNNITSDGIINMKDALVRSQTIHWIGLQSVKLCDEGAVTLAECIADNPAIQKIDLRDNNVKVGGLMALLRSICHNNNVVQIDLDCNSKSEVQPDLVAQHISVLNEIKEKCEHNQKTSKVCHYCPSIDILHNEKIVSHDHSPSPLIPIAKEKKYWSPSPSPSPSLSPSLSPLPSPAPSPTRNRFRVFKVQEQEFVSVPSTSETQNSLHLSYSCPVLSIAVQDAPYSSEAYTIPAVRPKTSGGRFKVTKVEEPEGLGTSGKAISVPCLASSVDLDEPVKTKIVFPNSNKADKGFDVKSEPTKTSVVFTIGDDLSPSEKENAASNIKEDFNGNNKSLLSFKNIEAVKKDVVNPVVIASEAPDSHTVPEIEPVKRAPLASIENTSFDSDSEDDSEVTQSSESVLSDDFRVST